MAERAQPATVSAMAAGEFIPPSGVHPDSLARVERARSGVGWGALAVLTHPDPAIAFDLAVAIAVAALGPDANPLDLVLASTDNDTWTLDELNERVIRPARVRAFDTTHIVVADADRISIRGFDHLLKSVEEPAATVRYWLTGSSMDAFPITILGRSGLTEALAPVPSQDLLAALSTTTDPAAARRIVDLAGTNSRLAAAVAGDLGLLPHLRTWATIPSMTDTATATTDALLTAIFALAKAVGSTRRAPVRKTASKPGAAPARRDTIRPQYSALTDAAKPHARRLARAVLDRWVREAVAELAASPTPAIAARVAVRVAAVAAAHDQLRSNAPLGTALAGVLAG